ncbi:arylsulfatase [Lentibacillus kapialis]|uniref:Arylsulfatase n=1 Tax=Lentibacillus kapialis TaxID=340214 RepID=A0A917PXU0_9BACI|nr:arylsulfatase [Lentibacillus kapialis]GGJ98146.1 arylsulfatase [Lentibacillus kapialis]
MKPNVLLIMVDQMRADCISMLNHPVVDTPNLDQLARDGALFQNAYSATPSCVPARASAMTGMSQTATGRTGYQDEVPWKYEHTVAGEFSGAGYHTQSVGKMHVYPTRHLCGFHNVVLHDGYMHYNRLKHQTTTMASQEQTDDYVQWLREKYGADADLLDSGLDCNASTVARPWHLPESLHPTNWVTTQSIDFLRRRDPSKPFFLNMSFVRPHPPLDPPQAFYDMYKDVELPDPPVGDWAMREDDSKSGLNPVTAEGVVPKQRYHRAQAAYYALITHIDHQIGRFLQVMQEYGVYRDTIILFASDHGELLGDHHLYRKSLPYEGSAKVPFILADPGNHLNIQKNTPVDSVVEMRDIMPTLLDAAGISIPGSVEGKSVVPLCRGETGLIWRDYIHGEHEFGKTSYHYITDGNEKYIWFSQTGVEQFFDLLDDPEEKRNLAGISDYSDRVRHRRDQLIKELTGRDEGYTDGESLIIGKPAKAVQDNLL